MSIRVARAKPPEFIGFGRIHSNLDLAGLERAHAALDSLRMRWLTMQLSSALVTAYDVSEDRRSLSAVTSYGPGNGIEHRAYVPDDPSPNRETSILVTSTTPMGRTLVRIEPAIANAVPFLPHRDRDGIKAVVDLAMDAVATAIAHHGRPEPATPGMNASVAIGAALEIHADDPPPAQSRLVFTTGRSRLTPGMLRTARWCETAIDGVDAHDWERLASLIPAATRINGSVEDDSGGNVPETSIEISPRRSWARFDHLPVIETMRAHAAWETVKNRTG